MRELTVQCTREGIYLSSYSSCDLAVWFDRGAVWANYTNSNILGWAWQSLFFISVTVFKSYEHLITGKTQHQAAFTVILGITMFCLWELGFCSLQSKYHRLAFYFTHPQYPLLANLVSYNTSTLSTIYILTILTYIYT